MDKPFYFVDAQGQRHGPVPSAALRQMAADGTVTRQTPVWAEGMVAWAAAGAVAGLLPPGPPPLPPAAATPAAPPRRPVPVWAWAAGGGVVAVALVVVAVFAFRRGGAGTSERPKQMVGRWSGRVTLAGTGQGLPFEFSCSEDGALQFGFQGELKPTRAGETINSWGADGASVTLKVEELETTATSVRCTVSNADSGATADPFGWRNRGVASRQRFTYIIRRDGDELDVEVQVAEDVGQTGAWQRGTLTGRLRRQ